MSLPSQDLKHRDNFDLDFQSKAGEIFSRFDLATSEQELHDLIGEIDGLTLQINSNLDAYIGKSQSKCQQDLTNVELNRARLSETISTSSDLIKVFSSSNDLGNSLTYQLRSLDKQIDKVNHTSDYVSKIKLLKNNINQAVYALEHNNWQLAAKCIHTIRTEVPKDIIDGQYASHVIPSSEIPELPQVVVDKSISQLVEIFKAKFDEAASQRNIPELTTFFQLFPLVGKEEVGLICYSKFICQIITDTSRSLVQSATRGDNPKPSGLYSRSSMQLFENISMMLSQHAPLIKKYYSSTYPMAIPFVITRIQHEIDSQIGLITDTFYDDNRIEKVLQDIRIYKFPVLSKRLNPESGSSSARQSEEFSRQSFDDNELVTIVQAGDLFAELANILHYWSLYCKFISTRYFNEVIENTNKLAVPSLIFDSNFTKKIQSKYLLAFESIFMFYFRRSLEKAISIEELPSLESYLLITNSLTYPEQPPCSSVIEDFTLVLNNCLRNIINSGQESAVKTFATHGLKIIQQDLINGYILKELNENQPRYNSSLSLINPKSSGLLNNVSSPRNLRSATPVPESAAGAGTGGMGFFKGAQSAFGNVVSGSGITSNSASGSIANNPKLVKFIIYLNTVAVGQEYVTKIIDNFTKNDSYNIRNYFPFGDDADIVTTILKTELLDPFVSTTNKLISEALITFYNQSIKTRVLQVLADLLPDNDDTNYLIYSSSSLNDTALIFTFITQWRTLIRPYKQIFQHEIVYNKLLRLIVLNLANFIEKRLTQVLRKFKINELGALKLEKDISSFISEVCEDNYELREKFVRVTQLVLLVGMDDEEYEESNSYQQDEGSTNANEEDDDNYIGIKWVLTPLERRQFRKFRI